MNIESEDERFEYGTLPPHPLDLAYWTLEREPKFDEVYFLEDVRKWVAKNNPFNKASLQDPISKV
jgi:hypothetical protein